ncbi:MAG: membrane integrity-associated transporter subunit PqiC [Thiotrichaceae bacterium]|nr:membrane integrity-associated transporter subunit PqiC [Thiotrichaceae bacterium]
MIKILTIFMVSLLLVACSSLGGKKTSTRFYSISPIVKTIGNNPRLSLGIGPIRIPVLLRRPQIISRISNNELKVSEQHHWAGSLREDISQALIDNIASLSGTSNVEKFPWKRSFKPNYQVRVQIEKLDGQVGGNITLKARWWLRKGNAGKDFWSEQAVLQVTSKGDNYSHYVEAQSEAVFQLSKRIVQSFK